MLKLFLICMLIIAFCVGFMCLKILLQKNGRFPNIHVSGSKAMRKRGITCVQSQDFAMRKENRLAIKERTESKK
ncbi:MAG: hypothetical protein LUD00_05240 [Prevotellaceae bacterium]|nr:hypothetical protein [Prevotellaceae bacterium]